VTGWIKTEPIDVIDTTLKDSIETFANLKQHYLKGYLEPKPNPIESIKEMLKLQNVNWFDFKDWKKIDDYEKSQGEKRYKVHDEVKSRREIYQNTPD